ncbi:MAG: tetraacyldisaccharide 4'-kinase [Pseudomonadota bacterium]
MRKLIYRWQKAIYRKKSWTRILYPFSMLFGLFYTLRRALFHLKKPKPYPVPVVVVGNITLGGTGKTPLLKALVSWAQARGLRPGIISRGYGRTSRGLVVAGPGIGPEQLGDEPFLLWRQTQVPVCVAERRALAAQYLIDHAKVDIIFSDDGLQHHALYRDLELVVFDADRGVGNGRLLPAGPLREPLSRLKRVDVVLVRGGGVEDASLPVAPLRLRYDIQEAIHWRTCERRPLGAWVGQHVVAAAGIGYPDRFFTQLRRYGLLVTEVPLPDHAPLPEDIWNLHPDWPLFITEKDAIKLTAVAPDVLTLLDRIWVVPLVVTLPVEFTAWFKHVLEQKRVL